MEEKRAAAAAFFEKHLQNKEFKNEDWGKDIKVLSLKKALHEAFFSAKVDLIKHIPNIIKKSKYIGFEEDTKKRPNVKGFHYLACRVTINGKPQGVVLSVREDNNGNIYYNHVLRKNEEGTVSLPTPNAGAPVPSSMDSIPNEMEKNKGYSVELEELEKYQ